MGKIKFTNNFFLRILRLGPQERLTSETLPVALGAYLTFGGLHGALSFILSSWRTKRSGDTGPPVPEVALLIPMTLGLLKNFAAPSLVWPVIFGLNAIALFGRARHRIYLGRPGGLGDDVCRRLALDPPVGGGSMAGLLVVVGAMATVFFGAGYYFINRPESKTSESKSDTDGGSWAWPEPWKLVLRPFPEYCLSSSWLWRPCVCDRIIPRAFSRSLSSWRFYSWVC